MAQIMQKKLYTSKTYSFTPNVELGTWNVERLHAQCITLNAPHVPNKPAGSDGWQPDVCTIGPSGCDGLSTA